MSRVTGHVSRVTCQVSQFFFLYIVVELVGGEAVINMAYPVSEKHLQIPLADFACCIILYRLQGTVNNLQSTVKTVYNVNSVDITI